MSIKQNLSRQSWRTHLFCPSNFLTSCLVSGLITLIVSIVWFSPPLKAQDFLPGFNLSSNSESFPSNIPVFKEGNLQLAPVFLDGKVVEFVSSKIGGQPNIPDAASRAGLIHRKLQGILEQMSRYTRNYQSNQNISQPEKLEKIVAEQLKIIPSKSQDTFVVLIAFPQQAPPEILFSITKADAQRVGLPEEKFAQESVKFAREILLQAWKERQSDYLWTQAQLSLKIFLGIMVVSLSLLWGQKHLQATKIELQHLLSTPTNSAQVIDDSQSELGISAKPIELVLDIITARLEKLSYRQEYTINAFLRAILLGGQVLLWVIGLGYICSLFYWSRPLSNWLLGVTGWNGLAPLDWLIHWGQRATLGVPLMLLLLVLGVRFLNQGSYILIDSMLGIWVEEKGTLSPSSERYQVRGPTLAAALKGLVTVLTYFLLGIFILHQLGALPNTVTVILGLIGLGISLGAQNFIKDVINGCLILWQDRYAVGDWIAIDEFEGLVENLSLQMTQLRNLEGELITIPNGTISRVRNMSSGWSQVKFAIDISYDADVEKAMSVMKQVADQIYEDPFWQDRLLGSPRMLGVERLEHTGVNIRILLKTKPLQQWAVAREYRRRLKKAFDESEIEVGLPRHLIFVNDTPLKS
jgi:small conductance mechanosensitive channel